jgi:hypothetical protein
MNAVLLSPFTNKKKKLLKLTDDQPELESRIDSLETYEEMLEIIKICSGNPKD